MKQITKVGLSLLLGLSLVGCSGSATNTPTNTSNANSDSAYKVGIIQYVKHVALDRATEGFKDALNESGLEISLNEQNANGEGSNCETIANILVNDNVDLIFANATPAAQAVAGKTTEIPIVVTSVTDPESAGLVNANDNPGTNVTGTSDLTPVEAQINLLKELFPGAATVGILYTGNEDNSIFQADLAKKACEEIGLAYEEYTVSDSSTVQSTVESMIGKVDVGYIPTDNLLAETMATVSQVATANQLPFIVGEVGMVENGGLATYGIDYYNLGKKSGEMAIEILKGADPSSMAIEYLPYEECELSINMSIANELGMTIPDDIQERAHIVE